MTDLKKRQTDINEMVSNGTPARSFMLFKFVRPLLALIIIMAAFGFLYILVFKPIPKENENTINLVVGFVLSLVSGIAAYYFGTSKDKSDAEQSTRVPNTITQVTTTQQETPEVKQ
jgi:hypothetical protein